MGESSDARRATQANVRLEHEHKNPRDELGKTAGCAACARPGSKKHSVACQRRQEEFETKTSPQSERTTHATDTEIQQDTQADTSTSTVRAPTTDTRDTDQLEHGNDESENSGQWTPVKPSRMKSSPLVQSKRSREMPTILEQIENDELQGMGTGATQTREKAISQSSRQRKNTGLRTSRWMKDHRLRA